MGENWLQRLKMMEKAFCGNGIIHLNIAEFHEDDIGGQKKRVLIGDQGHEMGEFSIQL
jgi:hypothetical protein